MITVAFVVVVFQFNDDGINSREELEKKHRIKWGIFLINSFLAFSFHTLTMT